MKKFTKRAAALLLAVVLALSLAGCYSEDLTWAAKSEDMTMPIGSYIYYLSTAYNEAAAKVDSESKVLDSQIDGKDAEDWIRDRAELYVRQYFWLESEMERLGLEMTDADYEEASNTTYTYWSMYGGDELMDVYGISENSFDLAYSQYNVKYLKVFDALYSEGGEMEVPESEIAAYFNSDYYNYEYFTVPLALPDAQGNPVDMTEEEIAALTENLESVKSDIEKGELTVEEAAEDFAEIYKQEDTSYVTEVNNTQGLENSYMPAVFTETLPTMHEGEIAVFETSSYMVVLKRLPTKDALAGYLNDANGRLSIVINLKHQDYRDYVEAAAAAFDDIELNSKAIARYKPKMFAQEEYAYGTFVAEEESDSEETGSEETSSEETAEE